MPKRNLSSVYGGADSGKRGLQDRRLNHREGTPKDNKDNNNTTLKIFSKKSGETLQSEPHTKQNKKIFPNTNQIKIQKDNSDRENNNKNLFQKKDKLGVVVRQLGVEWMNRTQSSVL